jgi:hypothetical protein
MSTIFEERVTEAMATFSWKWTVIAFALGALLITVLVEVVRGDLPRTTAIPQVDTVILTGTLAFVLMGVLVGYASPGRTIMEAGVAGLVLGVFAEAIAVGSIEEVEIIWMPLGIIGGFVLSVGGAWVGEMLQGTLTDAEDRRGQLQWPWIGVGVIIGVMLNSYSVLLGRAIFGWQELGILIAFSVSFILTGFFVGLFSPGITLAEPALAAVGVIVVNAFVTSRGLDAPFPLLVIIFAAFAAFILALVGGWFGEIVQANLGRRKAAAGPE